MATFAHEDRGLHRIIGIIADHVLRDPDDGIRLPPMFDGLADGIFKSEDAGARFVNDGGRTVGEVCAGEVTSFDDLPADRGTKIGVNENVAEREGFCFLTHSFPFEYIILIKSVDVRGGVGDIRDHTRVEQALAKGLIMRVQFMRIIGNGDQSGLIIAQRLIFGKLDLAEYDDGADDQCERDGELGHDKNFCADCRRLCLP